MTKEGGPPRPGPPRRWFIIPRWDLFIRSLISMTSMGNPELKAAGDNAAAFGMLVAFSARDQVTKSMNLAAFIVGGGMGKMVCGGGKKAEGVCVGTGTWVLVGVDSAVVYMVAVGRGADLSMAHCISWRRFTALGVFGVGHEGPATI